ncbi:glycoside hydrolase family 13 protein [Rubellicoccus peritrichatus]|uniref:Glycoside hydrolase family 13 protein n=1 Tax=Rubellicoccus peritrichatus TaxID=3080537 RepID=A0AAQ3L9J7_9BACT|nr:glycoside hydrolase family 13 protein [Puniceicoccus sp. CR14]WOO41351.1 glycoside hydrolase family 13 protein [Puniceicoccus sp. CR14]
MTITTLALFSVMTAVADQPESVENVPAWSEGVVWYQIFPERFRNGDPSNDPTRDSLEWPINAGSNWEVSSWTADWYSRLPWEEELSDDFYGSVLDRRFGGDMQGVIDKLDYIKELGITAIYFNPVFFARSLHKYDGNSFHHIDPFFGPDPAGDFELMMTETSDPETWHWTAADKLFLEMVKQAHDRGIRVIIDGVWNHTGRDFFAFRDLMDNQEDSPYVDWYIVRTFDDPETARNEFDYESWWGFKSLPIFADTADGNDQHAEPKAYIFAATKRWMDPNDDGDPSDGIDGWRLDVAEEVPAGFWRDWNAYVREINPEAYTSAEVWGNARHFLEEAGFSASMNYYGFASPVKAWMIDDAIPTTEFAKMLKDRLESYPYAQALALQNLMDSHDTQRVTSAIINRLEPGEKYQDPGGYDYDNQNRVSSRGYDDYDSGAPDESDLRILRMIALMQAAYPGSPMVYYGTEAGMWGGDDPDDRMPMIWEDLEYDPMVNHPRKGKFDEPQIVEFNPDLYGQFSNAFGVRAQSDALKTGAYKQLEVDDKSKVFGFERTLGDERIVAYFNRSSKEATITIDGENLNSPAILAGTDAGASLSGLASDYQLTLPAVSAVIIGDPVEQSMEEVAVISE